MGTAIEILNQAKEAAATIDQALGLIRQANELLAGLETGNTKQCGDHAEHTFLTNDQFERTINARYHSYEAMNELSKF